MKRDRMRERDRGTARVEEFASESVPVSFELYHTGVKKCGEAEVHL